MTFKGAFQPELVCDSMILWLYESIPLTVQASAAPGAQVVALLTTYGTSCRFKEMPTGQSKEDVILVI